MTLTPQSKSAMPILATVVYPLRDGEVLLMHRRQEPNLGLWIGPGGKVDGGESPYECALRELHEETDLRAESAHFRGLATLISPRWSWLLFLYVVTDFTGWVNGHTREGELRWWPLDEVTHIPRPQTTQVFFPDVIDLTRPFYDARFVFDAEEQLVEVRDHSNEKRPVSF